MSSNASDQVHYNAVRRALENGNAAVMVGAGFSRNAENGSELAMWPDVAQELWRELNPNAGALQDFSASTVTQLGEQYARVFSKPSLEELLKRMIPDDRVAPGLLHRSLLSLPWSEIFTTNYDTLLERAAEGVVDRAHYTVMCREDIPQSKILDRRRIVKLHGSFPSQRPFIFTEEDYRRYPERSAPFINLVRQSMLENVFCLIGFSGHDPNFLHWIGWVRDMLDEHALPIYLFVSSQPNLGEQKLLSSRGVTAVVLPTKPGVEDWDYAGRFAMLFDILTKPLTPDILQWGKRPVGLDLHTISSSTSERLEQITAAFSLTQEMRDSYPGWIVTPYAIRKRFYYTVTELHSLLHYKSEKGHILAEDPFRGIAILADYTWQLDILLQSMNDELAAIAIALLTQIDPNPTLPKPPSSDALARLRSDTPQSFRKKWRELAVGVLKWAREGVREDDFISIRDLLISHFPSDLQVSDQIAYEDALLKLYMGEIDLAHASLKSWDVRSPDSYMLIRKGMLLGEVGDIATGLRTALVGLKRLRMNQRSRANSILTMSQEAWACLAIGNLQRSKRLVRHDEASDESLEFGPEDVTQRLTDLAAAGHDVSREMLQLTSDLNAETLAPHPAVTYTPHFELGRYSTTHHHHFSLPYKDKVNAAFAWLSLTDRVALTPRAAKAAFYTDEFAQAAWWIQPMDSVRRVLAVMVRLVNSKMLEPHKSTQFIHSAGWLSRYQVAKIPHALAEELFERSMNFIERALKESPQTEVTENITEFHLLIQSRLIIRCNTPNFAKKQLERIVNLYNSKKVLTQPSLWEGLAKLTSYCFEALSAPERLAAASLIASIPDRLELNIRKQRFDQNWLNLHQLRRREGDLSPKKPSKEIEDITDGLISRLAATQASIPAALQDDALSPDCIWARLLWLKAWGFISKAQTGRISKLLMAGDGWPIIAGHYPWVTFIWLNKLQLKTASKRWKQWILSRKLPGFSAGPSSNNSPSGHAWSIQDFDDFLVDLYSSLRFCEWSEIELESAIKVIKTWWDQEWPLIRLELRRLNELKDIFVKRMQRIDELIAYLIDNDLLSELNFNSELGDWLQELRHGMTESGSRMMKSDVAFALNTQDTSTLTQVDVALLTGLFETSLGGFSYIIAVLAYWSTHPKTNESDAPSGLISSLASIVSARRTPGLSWALNGLSQVSRSQPTWITSSNYTLVNIGLQKLLAELSYSDRPQNTGIGDDDVPVLRYRCVELAKTLCTSKYFTPGDACELWLKEAQLDPLPEIRFFPL